MPTGVSILGVPGLTQADTNAASYRYNGEMAPETALEEQALNRRQQIANLLLQRGLSTPPQGQMAGRFYVAPSPLQGAAQLAQAALGAYGTYSNDQGRKELADKDRQMVVEAMEAYKAKTADRSTTTPLEGPGQPVPTGMQPGEGFTKEELQQPTGTHSTMADAVQDLYDKRSPAFFQEGPQPTQTTTEPVPAQDKRQAMLELMANQHPQVRSIGALLQQQDLAQQEKATNREFLQTEKAADREVRVQANEQNLLTRLEQMKQTHALTQMQIDSREAQGRDANDLKKSIADQTAEIKRMEIQAKREQAQQGKTPPGYRQSADGNLEAIPGGPADLKLQGALNQDTSMLQNSNAGMDRLAASANQILQHPGLNGITGIRGRIPDIPGTSAADARALLGKLKSEVGFGVLQEMRNNSKTGGALGSVSDAEGKRLENNLAALDTTQSTEQLKKEIQAIIDYANGAKDRLREAYNMKHKTGEPVPMAPAGKGPAVGTVEGGYRFKGGDPAKPDSWEKQ